MPKRKPSRICPGQHEDCFAFGLGGKCRVCIDTNFKGRTCPFYKTAYQRKQEHLNAVKKLMDTGREDLTEKYGGGEEQEKLWDAI